FAEHAQELRLCVDLVLGSTEFGGEVTNCLESRFHVLGHVVDKGLSSLARAGDVQSIDRLGARVRASCSQCTSRAAQVRQVNIDGLEATARAGATGPASSQLDLRASRTGIHVGDGTVEEVHAVEGRVLKNAIEFSTELGQRGVDGIEV